MSASPEFVAHVRDLLHPIGPLQDGKFFGGHAFKYQGVQFAMLMGNTLYFRVNDTTRPAFEAQGGRAFSYATRDRRVVVRRYFSVPDEVLETPVELVQWARRAVQAA